MLVPEIFTVLGGLVEDLDAARKRFVAEVNKLPRGKRYWILVLALFSHFVLPIFEC